MPISFLPIPVFLVVHMFCPSLPGLIFLIKSLLIFKQPSESSHNGATSLISLTDSTLDKCKKDDIKDDFIMKHIRGVSQCHFTVKEYHSSQWVQGYQ